ncbi:hypothetical protein NX059_008222 [Plenodomus lindquistii]|nr:hypothetical protein NX059_008222 [Plenodomus lindquistii]
MFSHNEQTCNNFYAAFTDRHAPARLETHRTNATFADFVPQQHLSSMQQEYARKKAKKASTKVKQVAKDLVKKVKDRK